MVASFLPSNCRAGKDLVVLPASWNHFISICKPEKIVRFFGNSDQGFGLIEILLLVIVLGLMAAVAFKTMDVTLDNSRRDVTTDELDKLSWAIAGNPDLFANGSRTNFGYVGDVGSLPPNLDALVTNPGGYATWKGPYIQNNFTQNANDYKTDAWGNLYTYTAGVTVTSSGSGGNPITKRFANANAELTSNTVQGTVTDGAGNPPGSFASNVSVRIVYPNGSGGTTTATTNPNGTGNYIFANMSPQGIRTVTGIYSTNNDTIVRTAVVLPKSVTDVNFKFRGNLWGEGTLIYVPGSAGTQNIYHDIFFQIRNAGSTSVTVTTLKAVYATVAYYEQIVWGGTTVANQTNPRFASNQTVILSPPQTIAAGATVTVNLNNFRSCQTGGCGNVNMSGMTFTITFSDGSVITFSI